MPEHTHSLKPNWKTGKHLLGIHVYCFSKARNEEKKEAGKKDVPQISATWEAAYQNCCSFTLGEVALKYQLTRSAYILLGVNLFLFLMLETSPTFGDFSFCGVVDWLPCANSSLQGGPGWRRPGDPGLGSVPCPHLCCKWIAAVCLGLRFVCFLSFSWRANLCLEKIMKCF